MLVDLVADVLEPNRFELVKHGFRSVRVPPVASMAGELLDLVGDDARARHAASMPSSLAKGKRAVRWAHAMDHFQLRNGELYCEEVPLSEIAAAVGTPVYVYSTATMCRHVEALQAALEPLDDPLIAYAVKANPNSAVIATLARAGLGADVVSGGEYRRARAAGVNALDVVFSGVGKTEEEMRLALEGGLFQFNLESLSEAELLSAVASDMGRAAPVGFRVNPDVAAGGHAKITTGAAENKLGIAIGEAVEAYARIATLPGLHIQGVAVHIGSQLTSLDPLERAFTRVGELIGKLREA